MKRIAFMALAAAVCACGRDATAPPEPRFEIELRYVTPAPASVQQAMNTARLRWEQAIVGKLPAITIDAATAAQFCGLNSEVKVENLLVLVRVQEIDGPGGINGLQGTCLARDDGTVAAPLIAFIIFDVDNVPQLVQNGHLLDVAIHEIGHALGFGAVQFARRGYLQDPTTWEGNTPLARDAHFSGPRARAVFDELGGTAYGGGKVPLENCALEWDPPCIPGRSNSHWRETVFYDETMSTYLNVGVATVLSRVTLAALEDLGHKVDYRAASQWIVPAAAAHTATATDAVYLGDDVVFDRPIGVVNARGHVVSTLSPAGSAARH